MFKKLVIVSFFLLAFDISARPKCDSNWVKIENGESIRYSIFCFKDGSWDVFRELNGKLHGEINSFFPNSNLKQKSYFIKGKEFGVRKGWLPDGTLSVYKPYYNGIPVDTHKVWYDNKNQESIIIYDSTGNKNGWCRTWYENGNIQDSTLYTHGTKLQEFLYYENGKPMFTSTLKEDGYITSSMSWFPTGMKNGEVKNGNGKVLTPRTGNSYFDTLVVKDGKVQGAAYEYFKDR